MCCEVCSKEKGEEDLRGVGGVYIDTWLTGRNRPAGRRGIRSSSSAGTVTRGTIASHAGAPSIVLAIASSGRLLT